VKEIGKEETERGKVKAKGNDARARLLGTMEGRRGAAVIGGNATQIPMEEVTPGIALPKLTRAKYQSERSQP
jgi:hypothetical protein